MLSKTYLRLHIFKKLKLNDFVIKVIWFQKRTIIVHTELCCLGIPVINKSNEEYPVFKKATPELLQEMKRAIRLPKKYKEEYIYAAAAGLLEDFWGEFEGELLPENEVSIHSKFLVDLAERGKLKFSVN